MLILLLVILFIICIFVLSWLLLCFYLTEFSIPTLNTHAPKHIVVVFPHADDEVNCGGTLHHFSKEGSVITLVILTKGERGTPHATTDSGLKEIRTREAQKVAGILGISKVIQEDFGDGELVHKQSELTTFLKDILEKEKLDLIITYDLAGLYGHEDHIICSEILTELHKNTFQETPLWYISYPEKILAKAKLPEHMAKDPHFRERRAKLTHKVFIGLHVLPKVTAWYAYKSQHGTRNVGKLAFRWFTLSAMIFEYFADGN